MRHAQSEVPGNPPPPLSLEARRTMQDEFFRRTIDIHGLLTALEEATDIVYFIKDAQGRAMGSSRKSLRRMGICGDDIIGKLPREYLPRDLADKYANDDQRVLRSGKPLRNVVEMGLSDEGARDWIITDKFPLRDTAGRVVGLVGTIQS